MLTKKRKRQLYSALASLVAALVIWVSQSQGWISPDTNTAKDTPLPSQSTTSNVVSVEDGDTITVEVEGKPEKIRLIGVDTPETRDPRTSVQCFGRAASEFTKSLVANKQVRLETDQQTNDRDRYNRLLRYVYLPDNKLVNAEIIRQGYGFAYTLFPFSKTDEFRQLEKQAQANELGLWGSCQVQQDNDKKTTNPEN